MFRRREGGKKEKDMDYETRKAARRAAFLAQQGKPQPRRVIRVYAWDTVDVLPTRLRTTPIGSFASRREADEFIRDCGPGTLSGSAAMRALRYMMARDEALPGFECYVRFEIVSEVVPGELPA